MIVMSPNHFCQYTKETRLLTWVKGTTDKVKLNSVFPLKGLERCSTIKSTLLQRTWVHFPAPYDGTQPLVILGPEDRDTLF